MIWRDCRTSINVSNFQRNVIVPCRRRNNCNEEIRSVDLHSFHQLTKSFHLFIISLVTVRMARLSLRTRLTSFLSARLHLTRAVNVETSDQEGWALSRIDNPLGGSRVQYEKTVCGTKTTKGPLYHFLLPLTFDMWNCFTRYRWPHGHYELQRNIFRAVFYWQGEKDLPVSLVTSHNSIMGASQSISISSHVSSEYGNIDGGGYYRQSI